MDPNRRNSKRMLEVAIDAVRTSEPDQMEMEDRASRVWARIGGEMMPEGIRPSNSPGEQIRSCADYRALIPGYIAGHLSSARELLLSDHTYECVACRNALNEARGTAPRPTALRARRRVGRSVAGFAIAATLVLGIVLKQAGYLDILLPVVEVHAMARTIDGRLYRIAELNANPVAAGDSLKAGEPVRTAAGSRAIIELADGTRIEMRERSQLSLTGTHDGMRINLNRGSVIVEAAKQRGHLYVATEDCTITVVGTVFAVSSGVKGSRVSVIEGEVRVAQSSLAEKTLYPGQQMATSSNPATIPIEEEISWSRNRDTHMSLLRALADVNNFLVRNGVQGPELRFTSTLLPLVPDNTVMYAAFPNISSTLGQAYDLFRQRIDQDPLLSAWWADRNQRKDSTDPTLEEMIDHARRAGSYLGEEIAIAVTGGASGPGDVIVLANVLHPDGLLAEINAVADRVSQPNPIRVLTDPAQLATFSGNQKGPIAYMDRSTLVLASSPRAVYDVIVARKSDRSGFTGRPFNASIAEVYSKGAGTLFAADLATLFSDVQRSERARAMGLTSIDRVVLEQKQIAGKTVTQAQLSFNGERTGATAWLAPPAPMGALEFVSPHAYGVAAIISKDALTILDEMLTFGGNLKERADELEDFHRQTGVDIRRDLAEPLGGEFLIAMDGPFLPTPSWKVVAEVYESARFQNTIERLVLQINNRAAQGIGTGVTLSSEAIRNQIYYQLRRADNTGPEVHYTYIQGYFVAAPSLALVSQALQYQQSRSSISSSEKFRSMMPADGTDHCSAILYQNLMETASSIASYVPSGVGGVTSEQVQKLRQTIELTPPSLVCATGEPHRIVMGYQGDLGLNVLMLGGLQSMIQTVGEVRN